MPYSSESMLVTHIWPHALCKYPAPFQQDDFSTRCSPACSESCFLVQPHEVAVDLVLKFIKELLHLSFAIWHSRQLKPSTNLTASPSTLLTKMLSNMGLSIDPLGVSLVACDLPSRTYQFSAHICWASKWFCVRWCQSLTDVRVDCTQCFHLLHWLRLRNHASCSSSVCYQ